LEKSPVPAGLTAPPAKASALREWRRSLLEARMVLAENRPCLLTEIKMIEIAENVVKSRRIAEKANKYAKIDDLSLFCPNFLHRLGEISARKFTDSIMER
jgi:predicted transcriptional regulator